MEKPKIIVGSEEWLEVRRKYVTATDATVIMGVNKWGKTPLQLYHEKISGKQQTQNAEMKRGLDQEDDARRMYENLKGVIVPPSFVVKDGWMAASLDGVNEDGDLVEIKCPGIQDHECSLRGMVPKHYYPQLQWQMEVKERSSMDYFSYREDHLCPYVIIPVAKDDVYVEQMKIMGSCFYDCLIHRIEPDRTRKDVIETDDPFFFEEEELLANDFEKMKFYKEQYEKRKKRLVATCIGSTKGKKIKITYIESEGSIDYSIIPELKGVDLEKYRKVSTISWRVDLL